MTASAPGSRPQPDGITDEQVILALDVDGALAPLVSESSDSMTTAGYTSHVYDGPGPDGIHRRVHLWLHPQHGTWLRDLLAREIVVAWATSWGTIAQQWIAPLLGLPADLPVIDVGVDNTPAFGRSGKLGPISRYAAGHPLIWVDDLWGGREQGWAADRTDDGHPTLLIQTHPTIGLTDADIRRVNDWLDQR